MKLVANYKLKNQGFTIVELLIVVVVIAILAAITIVSYNGITARANQSSALSTVASVQKKIESYNSIEGNYPISLANLTGDSSKEYYLPSTVIGASAPTASTAGTKGTGYVQLYTCKSNTSALSTSNITGINIRYWSYDTNAVVTTVLVGGITTCANSAVIS